MTSNRVRFALIGCGQIAKKHAAAVNRLSDAEIVGVYDENADAAGQFASSHNLQAYDTLDDLVRLTEPDVFSILTPSGAHAENVLSVIGYKRNVVVEKPIALRLDDVDRILEECDKAGVSLFVVQQNRFNPPVQWAKKALEAGRFGKLVMGTVRVRWCRDQKYYDQKSWRGTWALDGGVLTNQASHHIDMLLWMMGPVESVFAKTATRLVNIEAEDTGAAVLKFRSGALGIVEATTATRPRDLEGSISILGEKGSVEIGGFFMNELKTWTFADPSPEDERVWQEGAGVPKEFAWNHTEYLRNVVECIRSESRGLVDGLEGRKSIEVINAIYESSETGVESSLRFTPKKCRLGVSHGS